MNTDDGRIMTGEELSARLAAGMEELSRWTELTPEEHERVRRVRAPRRSATLSKMRGHLPPERAR